jgi:hypothetical protein
MDEGGSMAYRHSWPPPWRLKARHQYIAWSERARRQNLQRVACNSRFLIVPTVRVANLASHVFLSVSESAGSGLARAIWI